LSNQSNNIDRVLRDLHGRPGPDPDLAVWCLQDSLLAICVHIHHLAQWSDQKLNLLALVGDPGDHVLIDTLWQPLGDVVSA
jgi:hypothetical protein